MDNFDLRKFINNEKASFLSEGYDEFQRVDKGKKGVTKKDKAEEEVYGAGVKKGEKLEKEKLQKEDDREDDELSPEELANKYAGSPMHVKEEGATAAKVEKFHNELDKLVHKTFGHSSDEKKNMKNEIVSKELSDVIDDLTDNEEVRKAAKAYAQYSFNIKQGVNPKNLTDPLNDVPDEIYHQALEVYMDAKNMNEIGMFHDPRMSSSFKDDDDKWENGAYHIRYRMLKNRGVGEEEAKELADTYEDKPWKEVKKELNLNEVNIFDKDPYKKMLKDLMDKTGMSEKDARRAITDQINAADRESDRDEKRAFNLDEREDDPYDDYEIPGEKWLEEEEKEEEKEKKKKAGFSLGQALFLLSDEEEEEVRAWKRKIADDIEANGTGKYLKWGAKEFVEDFKKSLDEINEQMLDSETAIKKFLGYLIKPETMRRVGNTGNFVAKTRTGKVVLIEITPSGGGAIVYELDKEGKKLAKLDRINWGYPSLNK